MITLIIIFAVLYFFLAWWRLDWAVMILIAALPAYLIRFKIFGLPATLLEAMIWIVFAVWFLKNYWQIIENFKLKIYNSFKIKNLKFKINRRYPFDWEIVLLLFVSLAAVAIGGFTNSAFGVWKAYFFEPVLLFIVVVNVLKNNADTTISQPADRILRMSLGVEKILWPLSLSALAVSVLAVYQQITGQLIGNPVWAAEETRRVVSFFGYPNAVGLYLGPIVLLMAGWLFSVIARSRASSETTKQSQVRSRVREIASLSARWRIARNDKIEIVFISLTIIISVLSIYFAHSKGALLGVALGLILFSLLAGKKIRLFALAMVILLAAGVAIYPPVRTAAYQTATFKSLSGQIRLAGWADSWRMLKDGRIITGAGLANFQRTAAPYHTEGIFIKDYGDPEFQRKLVFNDTYRAAHWQPLEIYLYPHNIILNSWSELGLAGVLLFVWVIVKYFYLGIFNFKFLIFNQFSINKFLNLGLLGAMVVIVVHGIVDVPYFKNDLAAMFWLLAAMMGMISLENNNRIINNRSAGERPLKSQ